MRPMKLRSHLLLLTLGTVLPLVVVAAATGWIFATDAPVNEHEMAWLIVLGVFGTLCFAALLPLALADRIAQPLGALADMAKAVASGAPAEPLAEPRVREIGEVADVIAATGQTVRLREKSLRDADRAKDEFVAMLSHELRNPLGALSAAAQVLRKVGLQEGAAADAGDVVSRQVEHMTRMVEDLLDVSRVTRGKVSLARQPFDFSEVVDKTIAEMRTAGRLVGHEVRLDLVPVWVRADEARVAQIVSNLVGNAVKYTPVGGQIAVSLRRDRDTAVLRVRDSGIGMAPELATRVFDLFVQGEQQLDRGPGGLGIGLTLVKHLAELQGGKAFAASAGPGQGSTFTVTLPAVEPQPGQPADRKRQERRRHRIVLIEDNEDARHSLAAALTLDGHQVHEAADGISGIAALARVNPDIAVVDIGLPGVDGYKVAETLRGAPEHDSMVLIALTGYGQPDSLRRAREAGFDEYVTKPIAPERLVRLMDVALEARARRAAIPAVPRDRSPEPRSPAGH
jgi:signal transduction histidine kinase/ActR/RegA family two-component response regulator